MTLLHLNLISGEDCGSALFNGETAAVLEDGAFRPIDLNSGFDQNPILGMVQIKEGDLWFGLIASGIYVYDGAVTRFNSDPNGPGQSTIFSMIQHTNKDIWIGTFENGLWRYVP